MAYQVTARKWRPQKFADMVGQEHIARTLRNAIISGRIAHAYLFVGPRGIGKTTTARIFAKALNCQHPVDGEPCCQCPSCKSIADESSVDVIEIDAATHTQVEKARDICEDVLHMPTSSKYKIYIIDEVHMLSKSAWNALLKTIEEPPAHAKFIFATTEVNKVLPTVISRCQRFDLCRIPSDLITKRLAYIASQENINISQSALNVIARAADGGMRDAQSLLDQLVSFFGTATGNETISESQALSLFGLTAPGEMEELLKNILTDNRSAAILSIHQFAGQGKNLETLFDEILSWLRGILMTLILPDPVTVLEDTPEKIVSYKNLSAITNADTLQILMEQLAASSFMLREAINKQVFMETILMKAMRAAHAVKVEDLLIRLNQIRKNGELDGIEKIPSLQAQPITKTVYIQMTSNPSKPGLTDTTVSVNPPVNNTVAESSTPALPDVAPSMEKEEVTVPPVKSSIPETEQPLPGKENPSEINKKAEAINNEEDAQEHITEISSVNVPSISENETLPEEEEDESSLVELSDHSDDSPDPVSSMLLKERFSPEFIYNKMVNVVSTVQPALGEILQIGYPDRIEQSTLVIVFDEKLADGIRMLVHANFSWLQEQLQTISGDKYAKLSIEFQKGMNAEEKPKRKLEDLKKAVSRNAMVCETQDLFNGAIVDVFE